MAVGDQALIGDDSLMMATFQREGCTPDVESRWIEGMAWIGETVEIEGWAWNGGEVHQETKREEEANSLCVFLIAESLIRLGDVASEILDLATVF